MRVDYALFGVEEDSQNTKFIKPPTQIHDVTNLIKVAPLTAAAAF